MPKGCTQITTRMVFDARLGTLVRKARLRADGHNAPGLPKESTYNSSVPSSRDLVRTFFLVLAALNGLEVLSAGIQNTCLSALLAPGVKYYTVAKEANGLAATQDGIPHGTNQSFIRIHSFMLYGTVRHGRRFNLEILIT